MRHKLPIVLVRKGSLAEAVLSDLESKERHRSSVVSVTDEELQSLRKDVLYLTEYGMSS